MKPLKLHNLSVGKLHNPEASQLVVRLFENIEKSDHINIAQDPELQNFATTLQSQLPNYNKGLVQIKKKEETDKITLSDEERDDALQMFKLGIKSNQKAKTIQEKAGYTALIIIMNQFRGIENQPYEKQTALQTALIELLYKPENQAHINALGLLPKFLDLVAASVAFNNLYNDRSYKDTITEYFDMKAMKKKLLSDYNIMASYVVSRANMTTTNSFYIDILAVINNGRADAANVIARRGN
jgi:hypothetical protein